MMSDLYQQIADENNLTREQAKNIAITYLYSGGKGGTANEIKKAIKEDMDIFKDMLILKMEPKKKQ